MTLPHHIATAVAQGRFTYAGEGMLSNYGDTARKGPYVEFFLDDLDGPGVHPFKGQPTGREKGQRVALIVVPIGDDEQPVAQDPAKPEKPKAKTPFRDMKRSQQAYLACTWADFQIWLHDCDYDTQSQWEADPTHTKVVLCDRLDIVSRSELDNDLDAAARWDALRTDFERDTGRTAEER